jgi:hypothetical protein
MANQKHYSEKEIAIMVEKKTVSKTDEAAGRQLAGQIGESKHTGVETDCRGGR